MIFRATIATVFFATWLSHAGPMAAQTVSPKVAVIHSGLDKLAVRIAAELAAVGYGAETLDLPPPIYQETFAQIATAYAADAVMRVSPSGNSVQIWVPDQNDPDVTVLQEVVIPAQTDQAEALIAFKSVELLRASFLARLEKPVPEPKPVAPPPIPPPPPVPPPPPPPPRKPESIAPTFSRVALSLQPAAVFSFGGLPPAFNIGLALHLRLASRIGFDINGLIPTFPMTVQVEGGTLDASAGLITTGVRFKLLPGTHRWTPAVSLAGGLLVLQARGRAETGYQGFTETFFSAVINGIFTLSFAVNEIFSLKTDASCGIALPKPVFEINDKPAFSYGSPLVTVLFGIEVRLL